MEELSFSKPIFGDWHGVGGFAGVSRVDSSMSSGELTCVLS